MKSKSKILTLTLFAVFFIFAVFQCAAFAGSMSISYNYVSSGAEFRLYNVAQISSTRDITANSKYTSYSVDLNSSDAAQTLASYIERDSITPEMTATTNSSYTTVFSGLDNGVYLILGNSSTVGSKTYTPKPTMVSVFGSDVTVTGKYDVKSKPSGGGGSTNTYTEVSALKVWEGSGTKQDVTVQLLRDGEVQGEKVLNSSNNWKYTWTGLDDDYTWTVVEKEVPENYTVSTEKDGTVFIITNKYNPPSDTVETTTEATTEKHDSDTEPTTTKPHGPSGGDDTPEATTTVTPSGGGDTPDSGSSSGGSSSSSSDSHKTPSKISKENEDSENSNSNSNTPNSSNPQSRSHNSGKLPQTGQLWWPVPIMSCAGVLFVILGIGCKRKEENNAL